MEIMDLLMKLMKRSIMVRRRGFGNPSKTSICDLKDLNEEDFRKAVYQKKLMELAFEGHRRMD